MAVSEKAEHIISQRRAGARMLGSSESATTGRQPIARFALVTPSMIYMQSCTRVRGKKFPVQ